MKNCGCKSKPDLTEFISCDTTTFQNGAMLYRQFNCDSSWLTFESKSGLKSILYSLDKPLIELTERLGYIFEKEYQNSLLFINKKASGGGFPVDFELVSKDNGQVLKEFGTIIFHSDDSLNNFVLYLSSDSLDTLTLYSVDQNKDFNFSIPKGRLWKTVRETSQMFPEFLFEEPTIDKSILTLTYKYLVSNSPEKWDTDKIQIDLQTINKKQ
jgi:hypothetical protein